MLKIAPAGEEPVFNVVVLTYAEKVISFPLKVFSSNLWEIDVIVLLELLSIRNDFSPKYVSLSSILVVPFEFDS